MAGRIAVTGATGDIGRAVCAVLAERGHGLHLIDLDDATLAPLAARYGATHHAGRAGDAVRAREALGPGDLAGLVHLAGLMEDDPVLGDDPAIWDRAIAANLRNAYDFATAMAERLPGDGSGRLVFMASLAFRRGAVDAVAYSAAKGGIVGLTRALARRLAPRATVNALAPGIIDTRMAAPVIARRRERLLNEIPLRRFGTAREVATVIAFLLGGDAAYVTGQCLNVDGGQIMT